MWSRLNLVLPLHPVAILDFMTVCNDFLIAFTLTISETRRTIQTGLYQMITDWDIEWGSMMVATITAIIPAVAMYFFLQRSFVQGLTTAPRSFSDV